MIQISNRARGRLFTLAAALSALLFIAAVVLWNGSWDKPSTLFQVVRRWNVGSLDFTNVDHHLTVAIPTYRELRVRDWYDNQQQALMRAKFQIPWRRSQLATAAQGSAAYQQAVQQLKQEEADGEAILHHLQPEPVFGRQVTVNLPLVALLSAIGPVAWIIACRRRNRGVAKRLFFRVFRWNDSRQLSRSRRILRSAFACSSAGGMVLTTISLFFWGRSHLCSDSYCELRFANGKPGSVSTIRQLATHPGGILWEDGTYPAPIHFPTAWAGRVVDYEEWQTDPENPDPPAPRLKKLHPGRVPPKAVNSMGFHAQIVHRGPMVGQIWVVPFWFMTLCCAITPMMWALAHLKRREKPGHCAACGYDLTGNVSGLCPECGAPVKAEPEPVPQ